MAKLFFCHIIYLSIIFSKQSSCLHGLGWHYSGQKIWVPISWRIAVATHKNVGKTLSRKRSPSNRIKDLPHKGYTYNIYTYTWTFFILEFQSSLKGNIERLSMTFTANGKRQKWNFCRPSSALCTVESKYLYLLWIVRDTCLFLCDSFKDYKKRTENPR